MLQAELQLARVPNRSVAEKTVATQLPQAEPIAQLETMIRSSPRTLTLGNVAAMMNASPAVAAQRRIHDMVAGGSRAQALRNMAETVNAGPAMAAQRKVHDMIAGNTRRLTAQQLAAGLDNPMAATKPAKPAEQRIVASDAPHSAVVAQRGGTNGQSVVQRNGHPL